MPTRLSAATFRELVLRHFGFLESRGFRRVTAGEVDSPVGTSVAFAGRHVGFLVSWDVRDRFLSVRVTRARDGRLAMVAPEGWSQDLLVYAIEREGYRGKGVPRASGQDSDAIERELEAWATFLRNEAAGLLLDRDEVGRGETGPS
jgi:hypothetical protein